MSRRPTRRGASSRRASTASAISETRIGAPFLYAMISCRYSSADLNWSLASIVEARVGPSKLPFAWFVFAFGDRGAHVVEREAVRRERARVHLDAHRGSLAAADADESDARQLRDLLRDPGVGEILELRQRQCRRRERERHDRRVGRVDLVVDRRARQVGRQERGRRVDRRLHFLLGDVEWKREAELQRDHRCAARARRRHLVQARHLAELALERRRDRRGHHVRAGARIERHHLDRRIVDFGQCGQRQHAVRDDPRQQDRDHQQRGRDRPQDERA